MDAGINMQELKVVQLASMVNFSCTGTNPFFSSYLFTLAI